jgi:tetratricopeptide (TPR) repeat protein
MSKIQEAQEHIHLAEKYLKTSLLKWRPDYDSAADEYNKAAMCFKNAKDYEQCYVCLQKCADCHKQNRALFHAAKSLDQAVLMCKEMNNFSDIRQLAERACHMYQQHGSAQSGATSLDKAAKILEANYPTEALALYQHALEVSMLEESDRTATEYASKIARIMVKLGMFDQAADAIRREIGLHSQAESYQAIGRLAVALVLVQLARGDYVAAEKAFKEWGNCCDPQEVQTLEMLLQAFDDEDPETARQALMSPFIRHMDVEYALLARDLPLPKGLTAPKATVIENATASYVSPNTGAGSSENASAKPPTQGFKEEDDDDEGGLC